MWYWFHKAMTEKSLDKGTIEALHDLINCEGQGLFDMPQYQIVAGCDEAGRGPLAGAVFAAAVVMPENFRHQWLTDSKQLSAKKREDLRPIIEKNAVAWAVASVSAAEIDQINILQASMKAMRLAVAKLKIEPQLLLIDGNKFIEYKTEDGRVIPHICVVKGDAKIPAISAASILAKSYRDEYMRRLAQECPGYGWEHNMAYPTKEHYEAITRLGITKYHRISFLKNIHS